MNFAGITSMLKEAIGVDETAIGTGAIRHAILRRMQQSAVVDEASFLALLQKSPTEMASLIEELVVPETWFFRQREAFRLMQSYLSGEWRRTHPGRIPRILSIPSSSGEEAYSMAISLLDAGFTEREFHIDAIDISEQVLDKAKQAVYGKGSFRGKHLEFRERHFHQIESGYALNASVRHAVHFHVGNILDHRQMRTFGIYDIIFCRNLLIYFDADYRRRTVGLLDSMLSENGRLFVGHAETGQIWTALFTAVPHPMAFAYRRLNSDDLAIRAARQIAQSENRHSTGNKPVTSALPRAGKPELAQPVPHVLPTPVLTTKISAMDSKQEPSLQDVFRLADMGRMEEARQQCEAYLLEQGTSAQAWFLLGLISDSQGHKEQAKEAFRKALYLEPDHYETLVHFALLLDELGDQRAAQNLRSRVQRLSSLQKAQAIKS